MAPDNAKKSAPDASSASAAATLSHLLNTPNIITLSRLIAVPIFLFLLTQNHFTYALYVFAGAAVSDALDGALARWFNQRTELGAFLDPFADKMLALGAFLVLTIENVFPGWLLSVVVTRDVVIVFGYFMLVLFTGERLQIRPTYLGKACTVFQLGCVVAALSRFNLTHPLHWSILLYATLVITAASGLHYAYRGLSWLSSRQPQIFSR